MSNPKSPTQLSPWGADGLTSFIDAVRRNQDAFFEAQPEAMVLLIEVESLFQRLRSVLNASSRVALTVLAVRCHSFYLSAASAAMSGSTMEAQPLLRGALECAGYAAHLSIHPDLEQIWVARSDRADASARTNVRNRFGHAAICKSVGALNDEIGHAYRQMYQASIDLGAHPNVVGVMSSFLVRRVAERDTLEHHILTADILKVVHTASLVAQVGMISNHILRYVFPLSLSYVTDDDFSAPVARLQRLVEQIQRLAVRPDNEP
jgi:hypothetical protein